MIRIGVVFLVVSMLGAAAVEAQPSGPFTIARVKYSGGGDWYSDPTSLPHLLEQLQERIGMRTAQDEAEISLSDPELFSYPMLYLTGHGVVDFSDAEIARLREYVSRGGFLWADDNYGLDESFRQQMQRAFPDNPLTPLPHEHPVFDAYYEFENGLPKIHQHDGQPPVLYGIYIEGRLAVLYSYESDIGDGIEREGVHPQDPPEVREQAMKMAINIVLFALMS